MFDMSSYYGTLQPSGCAFSTARSLSHPGGLRLAYFVTVWTSYQVIGPRLNPAEQGVLDIKYIARWLYRTVGVFRSMHDSKSQVIPTILHKIA